MPEGELRVGRGLDVQDPAAVVGVQRGDPGLPWCVRARRGGRGGGDGDFELWRDRDVIAVDEDVEIERGSAR